MIASISQLAKRSRAIPAVITCDGQTAYHPQDNFVACFYVVVPKGTWIDCHGGVTYGDEDEYEFDDDDLEFNEDYESDEEESGVPGFPGVEVPEGYCVLGWDFDHGTADGHLTVEEIVKSVKDTLRSLAHELA